MSVSCSPVSRVAYHSGAKNRLALFAPEQAPTHIHTLTCAHTRLHVFGVREMQETMLGLGDRAIWIQFNLIRDRLLHDSKIGLIQVRSDSVCVRGRDMYRYITRGRER